MEKKKKIALISVVAVLCVSVAIWGIVNQNKKNSGNSTENLVEDSGETEIQEEPAKANGSNLEEFENKIKEIGFVLFDERNYDLFENDSSIAFVQIEEDGVKMCLNSKGSITNEKIKSSLALLLPNTVEDLIGSIKEDTTEFATSLDNRTVSIKVTEDRLEMFITN